MKVINIEAGHPTVEEARKKLIVALEDARKQNVRSLKIIHGYGSTGKGGTLRDGIRKSLSLRRKEGRIVAFMAGEKWGPGEPGVNEMIDVLPELRRDSDFGRYNEGITVVLVK